LAGRQCDRAGSSDDVHKGPISTKRT